MSSPPAGTVLGPVEALADGEVVEHPYDRTSSVLLVRRGAEVRAYRNLCPHHWLPLTWRSRKILSADGLRLRCSNHGAEFRIDNGSPAGVPIAPCGLEAIPIHVDTRGQVVVGSHA